MRGAVIVLTSALTLVACAGRSAPVAEAAKARVESEPRHADKNLRIEHAAIADDVKPERIVGLLREELERSMRELARLGKPPPYFLAYQAIDERQISVSASRGATVQSSDGRWRSLDVDLRVGSHELDNTHRLRGQWDPSQSFTRSAWLPIEDDPSAIRSVAWMATHREYQRAVEGFIKVKANKQVKVEEEDASHDFSVEPVERHFQAPATLAIDRPDWEERLSRASAAFRSKPDILESTVSLIASAETRYVVTSEKTAVQTSRAHLRVIVDASTVADDGMRLQRTESIDVFDGDDPPTDAAIDTLVREVMDDLVALRKAPVVEPFAGPALLDGRAAGVFFHEIFGHRVEGHRQKDEDEGQTFATKIGTRVMPAFLSVYDDPTIETLNGVGLGGTYSHDDEGVKARRASLVESGILRGFLMSRSPTRGFDRSNGHGRRERGHRVVSRQGNLVVDPSRTTTRAALKQMLLAEIARQGAPFGLRFEEITGGYTNTSRWGAQAFKVLPVMVYRVSPDGSEELVRGVDLEGTPLTVLSRVVAAANDFSVFNGMCGAESGWVPVSATSPSLLVSQIEVARTEKAQERPPLLPAPGAVR